MHASSRIGSRSRGLPAPNTNEIALHNLKVRAVYLLKIVRGA
jgi:hypothetical protein